MTAASARWISLRFFLTAPFAWFPRPEPRPFKVLCAGPALVANVKQASIPDPIVLDQIRPEFDQAEQETAGNHELLLSFQTGWHLQRSIDRNGLFGTSPARFGKSGWSSAVFFILLQ